MQLFECSSGNDKHEAFPLNSCDEVSSLTLDQYQISAKGTNVIGDKPATLLILGLFGEIGSVVSELKKKQREEDAYIGFKDSVLEELGDALWYLSSICTHIDISLGRLARSAFGELHADGEVAFSSIQKNITSDIPTTSRLEIILIRLCREAGKVMDEFLESGSINAPKVSSQLAEILRTLFEVAVEAKVSLAVAASGNLKKIYDRWPIEKRYPPFFDVACDEDEQIPRRIEMRITERIVGGRTYVFQRCNGINIGDRITDNKQEEDDYRFHDVFHLGYAAVLGWSPVIRALLKVKRKSFPKIDENEDGARAIISEEAVSHWIFNLASRVKYFEGLHSLEYGLLKAVRSLVGGYEVHSCPLWLWEDAILQGYAVFRQLRQNRQGLVIADLNNRKLEFQR